MSGDAIIYDPQVQNVIKQPLFSYFTLGYANRVTIESGSINNTAAGTVKLMNGFDYPNKLMYVNTGANPRSAKLP